MTNFLDIDQTETAARARAEQELEFAKLYVDCFVHNPAGRQLLEHWDDTLLRYRVPVNASLNEYVAVEARRAFVQQIKDQIRMAGMSRGL